MNRRAFISRTALLFLISLIVLAGLIGWLAWDSHKSHAVAGGSGGGSAQPVRLLVYCAAGVKPPAEEAARDYEKAYGVQIQLQYGGSQVLLASAETSRRGDLYLPADESYVVAARNKGLLDEALPLASMHPVMAVQKGNPKSIHTLEDLLRPDVKLAQANPEATATGKLTKPALAKVGMWDKLKAHTVVMKPTVNDVANDIKLGAVDAGFVWDVTVAQYPALEAIEVPAFAGIDSKIMVGVLSFSQQGPAALRFARYLAARDKGLLRFKKQGYRVVEGDAWSEVPELRVLAGAMLRPAIDQTITAFEQREGCRVTRVYNGCGILVAQMKAGEHPDAYFACDVTFMRQVTDLFLDQADVSTNRLVIVVPKGNPHQIHSLKDLGQPGLRIGVGHEKQCALGALTQTTLRQTGFRDTVMPNVKVQSPTGDMLINQLRTGSLDAVIAYITNTTAARDQVETIAVDIPCAIATQPVAVGRESQYKQLTGRLLDALESKQSKDRFESQGFTWTLGSHPAEKAVAQRASGEK